MKIFISWSGPLSRQIAVLLRDWLPNVIQAIDPWMSAEDIDKGARWSSEIARQLQDTNAGIICVTPDNQNAPWLNFEAGALSKSVDMSRVCTYLFHMGPSDLKGPLTQFQATDTSEEDTKKLVATLNRGLDTMGLSESKLEASFDVWWGHLKSQLDQIPIGSNTIQPKRSLDDMVQEVLSLTRDQAKSIEELKFQQRESEYRQLKREDEASRWAAYSPSSGNLTVPGVHYRISSDSMGMIYQPGLNQGPILSDIHIPSQYSARPAEGVAGSANSEPEIDPDGEGPSK